VKPAGALIAMLMLWPTSLWAAAPCVNDFDAFITRFERDPGFQRQTTLYPLDFTFLDRTSGDRPRTVKLALTRKAAAARDDLDFPGTAQQQSVPLLRAQKCGQPNACVVAFDKEGVDTHSIRFSFGLRRGCWRLVGIANIAQ